LDYKVNSNYFSYFCNNNTTMADKETSDEFYTHFKVTLEFAQTFPTDYTFKFIVLSEEKKIAQILKIFDTAEPQFIMKESKNGKYISITAQMFVLDADTVIGYYREVGEIEGVTML